MLITIMPLSGILITFVFFLILSVDSISFPSPVQVQSASDMNNDNNISISNNTVHGEQKTIRIFQQGMFNLNQTQSPDLISQDYVLTLDLSGNYTLDTLDKMPEVDKASFSGTLFGIENLAAMHEPQIQMKLDNIQNITLSREFKTLNYGATFIDEKNYSNLTAKVAGTLELQNPIIFDKVLDRQDAIPNVSIMNVTLGASVLNPVQGSPGIEINLISIS